MVKTVAVDGFRGRPGGDVIREISVSPPWLPPAQECSICLNRCRKRNVRLRFCCAGARWPKRYHVKLPGKSSRCSRNVLNLAPLSMSGPQLSGAMMPADSPQASQESLLIIAPAGLEDW